MDTPEVSYTIYRTGFADGRAYVGFISKEVAVRIRRHGQLYSAVNMELYRRLSAGQPNEPTIVAADVPAGKAYARELVFVHAEADPLNRLPHTEFYKGRTRFNGLLQHRGGTPTWSATGEEAL